MKVLQEVKEETNEGFLSLIGQNITVFCMNYIYTGRLVGVNDDQIKLDKAKVVYATGAFSDKTWHDAQALPNALYIRYSAMETYTVLNKE